MVQNAFKIMYREVRGLHQAAYVLAVFTFGSQILALIRDRLLAHQFGASMDLDLYYAAFRIPDVLYVIFASTLSVYVLIPFLAKKTESESVRDAQYLLSQFFSLFIILYSAIALIAIVCAPSIVQYLFPGFVSQSETLVVLVRLLLLQPFLLGISSLFGVVTQMEHRFILYALSPLLYNLGIIGGLLFLFPSMGIYGLVLGVLIGALGHVCIQIPSVRKSPLAPRLVRTFVFADIRAVCKTSFTRALTLSLHQLVLLGFVSVASLMAVGSVSVFQFAYNLQSVPLAIIGVSYSVAAFPLLAQLYAEKKYTQFADNITITLKHIIFWSLPVIALLVVIRAQFVRVILGSGAFDWSDTRLTAAVLALFILSLTAQAVNLLIVRALYAVENTRLPFLVTAFSSGLALVLAFVFHKILLVHGDLYVLMERLMRLEDVSGIEVLALPLGYSCALILHSTFLLLFSRTYLYIQSRSLIAPFIQSSISAVFAGYVAYTLLNYFVLIFTVDTLLTVLAQGFLAGIGGCGAYAGMQYFFKNEQLFEISRTLHKRFIRRDVVVPQDEDTLAV
jgi:putative peptidoglycan lipid II flippase